MIKKTIARILKKGVISYWKLTTRPQPKFEFEQKNIQNTQVLLTREIMLDKFPKNGVAAEIGVDEGSFSEKILTIAKPKKLHLIDFWGTKRYNQQKKQGVERKFAKQLDERSMEINIGFSTQVADSFQDNYFDWIYIDTDHSYKTTYAELEAYAPKVKKNGIIAGHDYIIGNWEGAVLYGVIEAVYEFCSKYDWELLYLTMENKQNPSFAIRRL